MLNQSLTMGYGDVIYVVNPMGESTRRRMDCFSRRGIGKKEGRRLSLGLGSKHMKRRKMKVETSQFGISRSRYATCIYRSSTHTAHYNTNLWKRPYDELGKERDILTCAYGEIHI